jgi:hypothetical protein
MRLKLLLILQKAFANARLDVAFQQHKTGDLTEVCHPLSMAKNILREFL